MSAAGYTRVTLADLPTLRQPGERAWSPIRHALGITAFGINAYTVAHAGGVVIDAHDESDSRHEELYAVLRGAACFTVADDSFDALAGALVWVSDPGLERSAVAVGDDTSVLCIGGVAGSFDPRPWEAERVAELSS